MAKREFSHYNLFVHVRRGCCRFELPFFCSCSEKKKKQLTFHTFAWHSRKAPLWETCTSLPPKVFTSRTRVSKDLLLPLSKALRMVVMLALRRGQLVARLIHVEFQYDRDKQQPKPNRAVFDIMSPIVKDL